MTHQRRAFGEATDWGMDAVRAANEHATNQEAQDAFYEGALWMHAHLQKGDTHEPEPYSRAVEYGIAAGALLTLAAAYAWLLS